MVRSRFRSAMCLHLCVNGWGVGLGGACQGAPSFILLGDALMRLHCPTFHRSGHGRLACLVAPMTKDRRVSPFIHLPLELAALWEASGQLHLLWSGGRTDAAPAIATERPWRTRMRDAPGGRPGNHPSVRESAAELARSARSRMLPPFAAPGVVLPAARAGSAGPFSVAGGTGVVPARPHKPYDARSTRAPAIALPVPATESSLGVKNPRCGPSWRDSSMQGRRRASARGSHPARQGPSPETTERRRWPALATRRRSPNRKGPYHARGRSCPGRG